MNEKDEEEKDEEEENDEKNVGIQIINGGVGKRDRRGRKGGGCTG